MIINLKESLILRNHLILRKYMIRSIRTFCEIMFFSWLIYGNFIYFSENNTNCSSNIFLYLLMTMTILLGFVHLAFYFLMIMSSLFIRLRIWMNEENKKRGTSRILQSLKKLNFTDKSKIGKNAECSICWNSFEDNNNITKL